MILITGIILLCLLYFLISVLIGIVMVRMFIFPKTFSLDYALGECLENGEFTEAELEAYNLQNCTVESPYDYSLETVYSRGTNQKKTVILVHGHTWNWMGQVKYFPLYRKRGYNIVAYNQRFHGNSGGQFCSGGFFEKQDLKAVVNKARELFPETKILGLMGESMGAATVLQSLTEIEGLDFVHADCPYSDLLTLFRYQLTLKHIPGIFHTAAIAAGRYYLSKRGGFDMKDVSPIKAVESTETAILLIHGKADWYVPPSMSQSIKDVRPKQTSLVLIPEAIHARSIQTAPMVYAEATDNFLMKIESEKS